MEYDILEGGSVEDLARQVNEKMQEGWEPIGGASSSLSETDESQYFVITQSMIKK